MPPYQYRQLQPGETRILEILPNRQPLTGKIHHCRLPEGHRTRTKSKGNLADARSDSCPSRHFFALSHHWGPKGDKPLPILEIQQHEEVYDLPIRPSLLTALLALRQKMRDDPYHPKTNPKGWSRYVWVDAVSINQQDAADKDQQLPNMGIIYNSAALVVVWLGVEGSDGEQAMEFIERLQTLENLPELLKSHETSSQWKAFANLTRRDWFTRLWIVQEISAAKEALILCGSRTVSWDAFAGAVSLFASQNEDIKATLRESGVLSKESDFLGELHASGANQLVEARNAIVRKSSDGRIIEHLWTLEALLSNLSLFEVSQAHDVVYSILWLSHDAAPQAGTQSAEEKPNLKLPATPHASPEKLTNGIIEAASHSIAPLTHSPTEMHAPEGTEAWPTLSPPQSPLNHMGKNLRSNLPNSHVRRPSLAEPFKNIPAVQAEGLQAGYTPKNDISINYEKPVYEMCKEVLEHIFKHSSSLDMLCYPWAPEHQKRDLEAHPPRMEDEPPHPTWLRSRKQRVHAVRHKISDKAGKVLRRVQADPFVGKPGNETRPYLACGKTQARGIRIEDRCLVVAGWVLGALTDVGFPALDGCIPPEWREMVGWSESDGTLPPDVFWRTLVAGKGPRGFGNPPSRYKIACDHAFRLVPEGTNLNIERVLNDGKRDPITKEYLNHVLSVVWDRCFIVSTSETDARPTLMGLGPKAAQKGDVICVLWGCSVPVLLRPLVQKADDGNLPTFEMNDESQTSDWTFVGECYIDGIMRGECVNFVKDPQDFNIY